MIAVGFVVREPRREELAAVRALMVATVKRDYGYRYTTYFHADIDDPGGFYLDNPRHVIHVAVDEATGEVVGTAAIRCARTSSPPHPPAIEARYQGRRAGELVRVYVDPHWRRRGVGRALSESVLGRASQLGYFDVVTLHSHTAIDFWRAFGVVEVCRSADGKTAYFERVLRSG